MAETQSSPTPDDAPPGLTEPTPPKKKTRGRLFRCFKYLALLMLTSMVLLGCAYGVWHYSAKSQLAAAKQKMIDRGEPFWFADLAPEPVDPDMDGTPYFQRACKLIVEPNDTFLSLLDEDDNAEARDGPTRPMDLPEFRKALKENQPALDMLRQAIQQSRIRSKVNYETTAPLSLQPDELRHARTLANLLKAENLQSLATNQSQQAVNAVQDRLALAELFREEPLLLLQLLRVALGIRASRSIGVTVANIDLAPDQFASLDKTLANVQETFSLRLGIRGERCAVATMMENIGSDDWYLIGEDNYMSEYYGFLAPQAMQEQAFMLDLHTRLEATIDKPGPKGQFLHRAIEEDVNNAPRFYMITRMVFPAALLVRNIGLRYRQALINARLGIRVDRYRDEHGKLPERLEDVLDDKLKEIPPGLFSDQPLVYRVLDDGFTIYPVGENGVDDGGERKPDRLEGGSAFRVRYPAAKAGEAALP